MKKYRIIVTLIFSMLLLLPLYSEENGDWYIGRTISAVNVTGLKNVRERTVRNIVDPYVGKTFSDELYGELDSALYSSEWLSYMLVEAVEEEGGEGVVLDIEIYENPLILSVEFSGNERISKTTLQNAQNITKGGWYSSNNLSANAELVKAAYLEKGYRDAEVEGIITEDSASNTVAVEYRISEGKQYKIKSISFEGNSAVKARDLKGLLTSKEKSFFNSGNFIESSVETDRAQIISYYATKGYPDAAISDVKIQKIDEEETDKTVFLSVVFVISEGEEWTIGTISFSGNEIYSNDELEGLITLKEGDVYNSEKINSVYTSLASKYYDNGYVYSQINPVITREDGNRVDISFTITEGPQTVVEEIRINGLVRTKPYVLEREMAIRVGDVFSRSDFIQSQQNMYNTSLLKNITANLYPGKTENGVICDFTVEEGNTMELQFGATFGSNEVDGFPVSGFLSLSNTNLGGTGRTLSVSTELSPTTQALSLSLSDGWVGDVRWSNSFSLSAARYVRSSTLQRGIGSGYYDGRDDEEVTYPLGYNSAYEWYSSDQETPPQSYLMKYDNWVFTAGYSTGYSWVFPKGTLSVSGGLSIGLNRAFYDTDKYDPYEILITKYHEKWQFSNKLSSSIRWDARNYVSEIPHGYVATLTYTYAGGILGGLSNYNKVALSFSAYRGIWSIWDKEKETKKDVKIGFSTEIDFMLPQFWNKDSSGWAWHDAKDGATKYEMLYIDGMNIGRGFSVQTDKAFLWNNQVDLTYPLVEDVVSAEAFISGTSVVSDLRKLSLRTLNWYFAAGCGIKMEIPGFPLGLYLVKNATALSGENFTLVKGSLFNYGGNSGLSLVLAITTSIY